MNETNSLHVPTACDTHECDDNVIFAQLVDLGDTSVCHRERMVFPIRSLTKARKENLSSRSCLCARCDEGPKEDKNRACSHEQNTLRMIKALRASATCTTSWSHGLLAEPQPLYSRELLESFRAIRRGR